MKPKVAKKVYHLSEAEMRKSRDEVYAAGIEQGRRQIQKEFIALVGLETFVEQTREMRRVLWRA
jgi:hypothetical protein